MKSWLGWLALVATHLLAQNPERSGWTMTRTELDVRLHAADSAADISGKLTIHNDGQVPLAQIFLQLTSTSDWKAITRDGVPQKFTAHKIKSDADHTGEMNEARVELAHPLGAGASAELEVAYSLTVFHESRRIRSLGAPVEAAQQTDWDRISPALTAVRGAGYVAWYPVALEPGSMAQGNAVFREVERWRARQANTVFVVTTHDETRTAVKNYAPLGVTVPVLTGVVTPTTTRNGVAVTATTESAAQDAIFSNGAEEFAERWLPPRSTVNKVWVLPEPGDLPFVSGAEAFVPTRMPQQDANALTMHAVSNAALKSPRPWIAEGYAAFLELAYQQQERGRPRVLQAIHARTQALAIDEPESVNSADTSLISSAEESRYRDKASLVWWMLRDLVGDAAFQQAMRRYKATEDIAADYVEKLLEAQSHRDLAWFFADWVYRDRGLPEFRVGKVETRRSLEGQWITEAEIVNSGNAGAMVPVQITVGDDLQTQKVTVNARSSTMVKFVSSAKPSSVRVNDDGSVPETDPNDNETEVK